MGDLISREALKEEFDSLLLWKSKDIELIKEVIDNSPTVYPICEDKACKYGANEKPQGKSVIKCQDCKYRVKEWREDKRMKEKGYWVYGCKHFGEIMGYWGFGGNDNEFCSDAERKGGAE